MIRKRTAIFFILIANIVLLVHAVVPHHHHNSSVCLESRHCQSDSHAHNQSTCSNDHEHDGSSGNECCVLKQAVVIPANSLRQEFKCLGCDDIHSQLVHFQAILFFHEYITFVPQITHNAQIPLNISSHIWFVSTSLGLRAPPVV